MKLAVSVLSLSTLGACATRAAVVDPGGTSRGVAGVHLELAAPADATHTFPALVAAALPSADRLGRQIRFELGTTAAVEVELCVAGGAVASVAITRPSRLPAFDASVVSDARAWRFAALPGPRELRTCERATVTYRAPSS